MRMMLELVRSWMRSSTSSTCAWIVTSSAVVGSSAMSTSGSFAIDIAIIARCRMPPEYSCGYWSIRWAGFGMPTRSSSSMTRVCNSFLCTSWCTVIASAICAPTVNTGFSAVSASWKIIAIFWPRIGWSCVLRLPDQLFAAELHARR